MSKPRVGTACWLPHGSNCKPRHSLQEPQYEGIIGTAAYMSPEQAKGRTADKRSDIWAFGAVALRVTGAGRRFVELPDGSQHVGRAILALSGGRR
jgi:serine/threonine protein kinase